MDKKLFEKHGYQYAQSKAYFKLYKNLGFAICINPDLRENNIYILYDSTRLIFKDITIIDEPGLIDFDTKLLSLSPKYENSFNSLKNYIVYLIDHFKIFGFNLELYSKERR
jgi:hypothetical protein